MRYLWALAIVVMTGSAWAKPSLDVWNSIESQVRGSQSGGREAPVNEFNQLHMGELPGQGTADSYLQYSHEFGPDTDETDLYLLQYDGRSIAKNLGMIAGRQVVVRNNYEGTLDGVTLRYTADHGLLFDFVGGTSRYLEMGSFKPTPGLLTGGMVAWNPTPNSQWNLTTTYHRFNYKQAGWGTNSTQLISLSGSQKFSGLQLYTDATFDTAASLFPEATVGAIWQITPTLSMQTTGAQYNTNHKQTQPTILSYFADGRLWQSRAGLRYSPKPYVSVFANYDWQALKAGGVRKYGNVVEVGVEGNVDAIQLFGRLVYRFLDSYGGRANDIYLTLHEQFMKKLWLDHFTNYSRYVKITNDNDYAIATGLVLSYAPTKVVTISAGGEYDRNEQFSKDLRLTTGLVVRWDVLK